MSAPARPAIIDQPSPAAVRVRIAVPTRNPLLKGSGHGREDARTAPPALGHSMSKNRLRAAIRPPATSILRGPTRAVKPCARYDRQLLASSQLLPAHSDVAQSCDTAGSTVPSAHRAGSARRGSMWTMTDGSHRSRRKTGNIMSGRRAATTGRLAACAAVRRRGQLRGRPSATVPRDASVRPAPRPRRAS